MSDLVAGIDLGGTSIKIAISESDGQIIGRDSIATDSHHGPEDVLRRIAAAIARLHGDAGKPIASAGMGVPGLVDVATGTTRFLPNLHTQWRDVPVGEILSKLLKCPIGLLNDARAATLAELRFGYGREHPDASLAFFTLGTGVGGGVAIDGRLRLGPLGSAGELGHQTIDPLGPRCGCGNRGCLETIASGPAIAAEGVRLMRMGLAPNLFNLVEGDGDRVTTREMVEASADDPAIQEAIAIAAEAIGIAAANVVTILHCEWVVLGGGVAEIGEPLLAVVRRVINERVGMFPTDNIRVEKSMLGEQAGVMGAVALAMDVLRDQ